MSLADDEHPLAPLGRLAIRQHEVFLALAFVKRDQRHSVVLEESLDVREAGVADRFPQR